MACLNTLEAHRLKVETLLNVIGQATVIADYFFFCFFEKVVLFVNNWFISGGSYFSTFNIFGHSRVNYVCHATLRCASSLTAERS